MYNVYIKTDTDRYITAIDSDAFITDTTDWIKIDEGEGDRYRLAQGNYLPKPITDMQGRYNYKYIDNEIVEVAEDDKPVIVQMEFISQDEVNFDFDFRLSCLELGI